MREMLEATQNQGQVETEIRELKQRMDDNWKETMRRLSIVGNNKEMQTMNK